MTTTYSNTTGEIKVFTESNGTDYTPRPSITPGHSRVMSAFLETVWAIIPDRLPIMRAVLDRWQAGHKLSDSEIAAAVGDGPASAARRRAQPQPRGVAVIPLLGVLTQRSVGMVSEPITATDTVRRQFRAAMNDPAVDAIVFDVDSPGGSVFGVQELAADIFAARGQKKVVAVANSLAASAAYWIGSAADEFVVTPGGSVGSIGVVTAHEDHSAELEAKGVEVTLISAGKFKTEGNPFGPLSDEARESIQATVNEYYDAFVTAVSRHRGVPPKAVQNGFGEGRTVSANTAVAENMVDRVATLDDTISRLLTRPRALAPRRRAAAAKRRVAVACAESETRAGFSR